MPVLPASITIRPILLYPGARPCGACPALPRSESVTLAVRVVAHGEGVWGCGAGHRGGRRPAPRPVTALSADDHAFEPVGRHAAEVDAPPGRGDTGHRIAGAGVAEALQRPGADSGIHQPG